MPQGNIKPSDEIESYEFENNTWEWYDPNAMDEYYQSDTDSDDEYDPFDGYPAEEDWDIEPAESEPEEDWDAEMELAAAARLKSQTKTEESEEDLGHGTGIVKEIDEHSVNQSNHLCPSLK